MAQKDRREQRFPPKIEFGDKKTNIHGDRLLKLWKTIYYLTESTASYSPSEVTVESANQGAS
jgi:hypothetical protein